MGVYSDTTQLNSTELNSIAWTTVDSVCRSWRHKQKHDWLGCTLFNWVSWVQLSWVELCRYKHPLRQFCTSRTDAAINCCLLGVLYWWRVGSWVPRYGSVDASPLRVALQPQHQQRSVRRKPTDDCRIFPPRTYSSQFPLADNFPPRLGHFPAVLKRKFENWH